MITSRRQFTIGIGLSAAGAALPTISSAGGDGGGGSFQNKPSSKRRKSYSKMTASELEAERKRLSKRIRSTEESIEDLERHIKWANRRYRKDKAEVDQLSLAVEQETDPQKKKKLNRQLKKANRELNNDGHLIGLDVSSLEQDKDKLVRYKSDMKTLQKWINYHNAKSG